jgi:hypothetical protein
MDEKVLSVTLSEADEKAMTKKSTTRRRRSKKLEGGEEIAQLEKEGDPVPAVPIPVASPKPTPAVTPTSIPAAPTLNIPGVGGAVKIVPKKNNISQITSPAPKLLMNKKRTSLPISSTIKKPKLVVTTAAPQPEPKKKRRFTERKISITMKPFATTRKHQKDTKDKVSIMPIAQVKKILLQKGLLKPNHKTPEDILRSMLIDYMMLHSED